MTKMEPEMSTLADIMPHEFSTEHSNCRAFKYADVEVINQYNFFGGDARAWPGPQKNVHYWVELANGYAVGMNENPSRGWSFPVVKLKNK